MRERSRAGANAHEHEHALGVQSVDVGLGSGVVEPGVNRQLRENPAALQGGRARHPVGRDVIALRSSVGGVRAPTPLIGMGSRHGIGTGLSARGLRPPAAPTCSTP